jgi:deoxyguanosine kinase
MARIEIAGGIASGKTTLASLIAQTSRYEGVYENFRENPFWSKFYRNRAKWVKEKNFAFLIQHLTQIKEMAPEHLVCDYSVIQDLAYATLFPSDTHRFLMRRLYEHLAEEISLPSLIVHLQCPSDILLQRIVKRGRLEEQVITLSYLDQLNNAIEQEISQCPPSVTIVRVQSDEINFVTDAETTHGLVADLVERASSTRLASQ